jgi:type 1 fimbria pilin
MRSNVKNITVRCVVGLAICFGMAGRPVFAQCAPTSTTVAQAQAVSFGAHTIYTTEATPGKWVQVEERVSNPVVIMGPNCGSIGMQPKSFAFQGTGLKPKLVGFTDQSEPIFEIKSGNTNVGVVVEVGKANGSYQILESSTTKKRIQFDSGEDNPALQIRLREYVRLPFDGKPGVLVQGGLYNQSVFPSAWDEIYSQNETTYKVVPLQVTVGTITLLQPTCTISPTEKNKVVDMGSVDLSQFSGPGTKSVEKPFTFELGNCNKATLSMHMTFESDKPFSGTPHLFPTEGRSGLGLGLISLDSRGASGTGEVITPDSQLDFDAESGKLFRFKAYLEQVDSDPVIPGGVTSKVRVLVNYD